MTMGTRNVGRQTESGTLRRTDGVARRASETYDIAIRRIGVALVTGALVLSEIQTGAVTAFADGVSNANVTQQQRQGQPPQGTSPDEASSGDGGQPSGTPPEKPDGDTDRSDISSDGQQPGEPPSGEMPDGGGANTMSFDYTGKYDATTSAIGDGQSQIVSNDSIEATESDHNVALAQDGGQVSIESSTLSKSGDDTDGDRCNFYGVNSAVLTVGDGSKTLVRNATISATSEGSNGIFATDSGVTYANNTSIETTADNSRGLDATYGGTIIANNINIATQGNHCAGIATDRGGGNISVTDSEISTEGSGSPLLYSTGDIEVSGLVGTATGSQIAGMEGLNTILIDDSTLTSTQSGKTASDPIADGVIIYQSTSGDAESTTGETATFQVRDSTLKSAVRDGTMFYLTNTTANVLLQNVTLDFDTTGNALVTAQGNASNNWGKAGSNGAMVNFTARGERMGGDAVVDTISTLDMFLLDDTTWTGSARIDENASATDDTKSDAHITINVGSDSTWVVTGDSTITNLNVLDGGRMIDSDGNDVRIVTADGTVLHDGTSGITVTVNGTYGTAFEETSVTKLAPCNVDRSGFDEELGLQTAFAFDSNSANGTATDTDDDGETKEVDDVELLEREGQKTGVAVVWDAIVSWFKGLFGMD